MFDVTSHILQVKTSSGSVLIKGEMFFSSVFEIRDLVAGKLKGLCKYRYSMTKKAQVQ